MSGILIPGQKETPEGGASGIELPKGMVSPKRDKSESPPESVPAVAAETESSPPPPKEAGRRQRADLLFPPAGVQIQCPSCGTPYSVPVFSIIDLGVNPELRGPLLTGQINFAVCPSCNTTGALSAPLLVHDPEHQFLGVFVPADRQTDDLQRQKVIGELTQTLMRKLPTESRRGYLLQPRQFLDWQRLTEVLWGFEGVTPEMLRRQRDQSALLQRLLVLVDDPSALRIAVDRDRALIDTDFFTLLERLIMLSGSRGEGNGAASLVQLRRLLMDMTEAGAQVKRRDEVTRSYVNRIERTMTRRDLLDLVLEAWQEEGGEQIAGTLVLSAAPLVDYQFLVLLSERLEAATDSVERERLQDLRELVLQIQDQQREAQAQVAQQSQAILQEILQATDTEAALREHADEIDETFLAFLAANIQAAEQKKATAAARRLRTVYSQALAIVQEGLPAELRLLNELLAAPDPGTARKLLAENRALLTREFLESLSPLEEEMRQNGRKELADRIKSLRGQIALMM